MKNITGTFRSHVAIAMIVSAACHATPAKAQMLEGKWVADWRVLDNGEKNRLFLDLKQNDGKITGAATTIGHRYQADGTLTGTRFEISFSKGGNPRKLAGEIAGEQLNLKYEGAALVAKRATPEDEYPAYEKLPLPPIKDLPDNGLVKTPPMGWNSWNKFHSGVTDGIVREMADAMVTSGMRDAGYIYLCIDDTWEGVRDPEGNLGSNEKFPDMKALADYVHSKGLKLGIYTSPGPRTCADYPGSYGHEQQDANTFAAWGVDYIKHDWCGARMIYGDKDQQAVYQKMGEALQATGRPIVYSICNYGVAKVETWGAKAGGNLWRTTGDIRDTWQSMRANIERQAPLASFAGPGHWNDPDMLEVGNGGMTDTEYRTHMSLWAITAAPLIAGNDIRNMTPAIQEILLNREVIAVNQDVLGKQATPRKEGTLETWVKPLADGSVAVAVVNLGETEADVAVKVSDLGLVGNVSSARDLWAHADVSFRDGIYTRKVASHDVLMLRVGTKP
ncbi:MAG: glycoside hydrolase family 27 protein [Verrucomicrobiota bacterium]